MARQLGGVESNESTRPMAFKHQKILLGPEDWSPIPTAIKEAQCISSCSMGTV